MGASTPPALLPGSQFDPVTPDAERARQLLLDELAHPIYRDGPSLLERVIEWVREFFANLFDVGSQSNPLILAFTVLLVVAVIATAAFLVAGPVRRRRRVPGSAQVLQAEDRTAADLRAAASTAADSGNWRAAVLGTFRALVRSLEQRAILAELPGRTADEAARDSARRFPDHAQELLRAGHMFDRAYYGERDMDEQSYRWLDDLLGRIESSKPTPVAGVTTAVGAP